jgi:hypothetical protein
MNIGNWCIKSEYLQSADINRLIRNLNIKPEFRSQCGNCGLKPGNANLPIGGSHDAIQENDVPGIAVKQSKKGPKISVLRPVQFPARLLLQRRRENFRQEESESDDNSRGIAEIVPVHLIRRGRQAREKVIHLGEPNA